jgi:hypothetical protein
VKEIFLIRISPEKFQKQIRKANRRKREREREIDEILEESEECKK